MSILGYRALTKIQSVALIGIVLIAALGGGAAYMLWRASLPPPEDIRIGICADINMISGQAIWRGAVLAAEQINAEGGVLGRNLTIVSEDDDSETLYDLAVASNAMTKLITVDHAEYVLSMGVAGGILAFQDICAEHKKILFSVATCADEETQRVIDNYDKYKYFFRVMSPNVTSSIDGMVDCVLTLRNYTSFTKVAILLEDVPILKQMASGMKGFLLGYGFDVVYDVTIPLGTTDFTSYFAAIETTGAEILVPFIVTQGAFPFVKEYNDRQSPFIVWGYIGLAQMGDFWELTDGKCKYVSFVGWPITAGYPLTSQTVPAREAYIERWNDIPGQAAAAAYDVVRFILPDAIERAGTTETEALIKALEKTNVETTLARRFVFTSSHDVMIGLAGPNKPSQDYMLVCLFQWQDEAQVPVYPKEIMEEAGATFKLPYWQGYWD